MNPVPKLVEELGLVTLVLDPNVNPPFSVEAEVLVLVGALNEKEGVDENDEGAEDELTGNTNPELLMVDDDDDDVVVKLVAELVVFAALTNPGRLLSHASH